MTTLADFEYLKRNIKIASTPTIKALHKLLFEDKFSEASFARTNRKRIREFCGFDFLINDDHYQNKFKYCIDNFSIADLVAISNTLMLAYDDNKDVMVRKILNKLTNFDLEWSNEHEKEKEDEDEEEVFEDENTSGIREDDEVPEDVKEDNEEYDRENTRRVGVYKPIKPEKRKSVSGTSLRDLSISFKDIDGMLRSFNGEDSYAVEKWVAEFEGLVALLNLNELQKLIFGKRLLSGIAKIFIQTETICTWKDLKKALIGEFKKESTSKELHQELSKRSKKPNETTQEYVIFMSEIASRGTIDEASLIQYIIEGIPDFEANKVILYGCDSMVDFKRKLRIYDKMKMNAGRTNKVKEVREDTFKKNSYHRKDDEIKKISVKTKIRCYNCGELGHHNSTNCPSKSKGMKCFHCNEYGHKAMNCPRKEVSYIGRTNAKDIEINNYKISALIDTGSCVNLLKQEFYEKMGEGTLQNVTEVFSGANNVPIVPVGRFQTHVIIDGECFYTNIYVVPNKTMKVPAIIGDELLKEAVVTINRDKIVFEKHKPHILSIEQDNVPVIDIGHDASVINRNRILEKIRDYKPQKCKSAEVEMNIIMKDHTPIYHPPRRLPPKELQIVDCQVEEWLEAGIIEPCSSEYSSQVVVTKKKDGTARVCVDYRKINKVIEKDRYPLPLIEERIESLKGANVFSTLDLKNGFFHVSVSKDSRKYTSFVTHKGQYQFLRCPFGLCTSPPVFQRYINTIFRPLMNEGVLLIYLDDFIIPAENEDESIVKLEKVLQLAKDYGLEINVKKCQFLKRRVEFLGHIIEEGKVYPSPSKTDAVMKFPEPKSIKQVQSFLGLTGYFRKFIKDYSKHALPLTNLLKSGVSFQFAEEERRAFSFLKTALSKDPVLTIYDPNFLTELHTDASIEGFGSILLQKSIHDNCLHPVYYHSRKTTDQQRKFSSYELEVLAIVESLKKFRVYLLGVPFKLVTDCSAFTKTMDKKDLCTRVARWAMFLAEFDYTIEHRAGNLMKHVDALSRGPILTIMSAGITSQIQRAQSEDSEIIAIKEILKTQPYKDYLLKNGILFKFVQGRDVLVVPKCMQEEVIRLAHEKGHFAVMRTSQEIERDYFMPEIKKKVEEFISNCVVCIMMNRKCGRREGQLNPIPKGDKPLDTFHIDHLGPLESTAKSYQHIFAVIDGFTKFIWLYPTKSTSTSEVIKKLNLQKEIFGNPSRIVCDRGTAFTSNEFKDYCKNQGIELHHVTTGLPRANGQVERLNRTLIAVLSKLSIEEPRKWYQKVGEVQQILNTTYQRSIGMTPFELLSGVPMKLTNMNLRSLVEEEMKLSFIEEREDLRKRAKLQLLKVQQENRKNFNKRRCQAKKYEVGSLVAIRRIQPSSKLRPKFVGPYRIVKAKGNDTYDVECDASIVGGPKVTSSCAEYMKPWPDSSTSETDATQNGRMWDPGIYRAVVYDNVAE